MSLAFSPAARPRIPLPPARWSHAPPRQASWASKTQLPPDLAFLSPLGLRTSLLRHIVAKARKQGVAAHEVLLADEIVSPDDYYACLALWLRAEFSCNLQQLGAATGDPSALRTGIGHIGASGPLVLAPQGQGLLGLLDLYRNTGGLAGKRLIIATPSHFAGWVRAAADAKICEDASRGPGVVNPELTAAKGPSRRMAIGLALLLAFVGATFMMGRAGWLLVSCLISIVICVGIITRLIATVGGCMPTREEAPWLSDDELPRYTILVPLYKEAEVVSRLLDALERINYPHAKLDIKLLIEADDHETRHAIERLAPGPVFEIVIAPAGHPRTKPRALNIGLACARAAALVALLAGGVIGPLVGPFYVALFIYDGVWGALFSPATLMDSIAFTLWCAIAALGALAWLAPIIIGARRRGLTSLLKLLPLLPVYTALLGLAAAMALIDLFRRPHHWAKTTHGLARSSLRTGRIG